MSDNYSLGLKMTSLHIVGSVLTWSAGGIPLSLTGISRLFPIDRTNGYDNSYRSLANNRLGISPTPFPSIVHSYCLLGVVPDRGSLTKVDPSRELVSTFRYPILWWL